MDINLFSDLVPNMNDYDIIVVGRPFKQGHDVYCPYSDMTNELLSNVVQTSKFYEIPDADTKDRIKKKYNVSSFPQILAKDTQGKWRYVGGYTELSKLTCNEGVCKKTTQVQNSNVS
jgi:glutaredoxin